MLTIIYILVATVVVIGLEFRRQAERDELIADINRLESELYTLHGQLSSDIADLAGSLARFRA